MTPDARSLLRPGFCSLVLLACSSCATSTSPQPEPARSVQTQMQVKTALLEADRVAAAPIRVEYRAGRLVLSGFVETEGERVRAAATARRALPGVAVVNNLQVWRSGE